MPLPSPRPRRHVPGWDAFYLRRGSRAVPRRRTTMSNAHAVAVMLRLIGSKIALKLSQRIVTVPVSSVEDDESRGSARVTGARSRGCSSPYQSCGTENSRPRERAKCAEMPIVPVAPDRNIRASPAQVDEPVAPGKRKPHTALG